MYGIVIRVVCSYLQSNKWRFNSTERKWIKSSFIQWKIRLIQEDMENKIDLIQLEDILLQWYFQIPHSKTKTWPKHCPKLRTVQYNDKHCPRHCPRNTRIETRYMCANDLLIRATQGIIASLGMCLNQVIKKVKKRVKHNSITWQWVEQNHFSSYSSFGK